MYYYQHHIGDYRRDTAHLSLLEHGIYRQLLDLYYISEKPLDANSMRLICARTADEMQAAQVILDEFFEFVDGVYRHKRCDAEIYAYHAKSEKAANSAKARWNKNKDLQDANALPTQSERNANGMLTINHKPLTNNHKPNKYIPPIPAELLSEWLAVRKKKPVTERVFNAVKKEAAKIGWTPEQAIIKCCERGWTGFESEWVTKEKQSPTNSKQAAAMTAFGSLLAEYIQPVEKEI
jgi:uncharacterized protein YdaU (DUF1376 family)